MALTDVPPIEETPAEHGAKAIREDVAAVLGHADAVLGRIRSVVKSNGRSVIAAELGGDAAAMLTVYNSLKDAVETGKAVTIGDLPE